MIDALVDVWGTIFLSIYTCIWILSLVFVIVNIKNIIINFNCLFFSFSFLATLGTLGILLLLLLAVDTCPE